MRPLTDRRPKPLLPAGDHSLIEHVFDTATGVVDEFIVQTGVAGPDTRGRLGGNHGDESLSN